MCIRDRPTDALVDGVEEELPDERIEHDQREERLQRQPPQPVSYTHLRAHETVLDLVCRLLLENKKRKYLHGYPTK